MSLNMASNVEHTRAYTFVEGKNLLFQDLAVVFLITLPIIGIWNGFHGNVDFRGKPMEKTFSLITQKEVRYFIFGSTYINHLGIARKM